MPDFSTIKAQIDALPGRYIFWTQKEIRSLPGVLDENEPVLALTSGIMNNSTWLAVCTDRRLIFLNCGMFFGLRQVQIPLDRLQSIDHQFGIAFGQITVWDGASYFTMQMVLRSSIEPFSVAVQRAMNEFKYGHRPVVASTASVDIASQLERLAALKERGHITEEEFQAQKKKLLG